MRDLCYSLVSGDTERLLDFSGSSLLGTEIYTSLKVCGAEPCIGSLWTGTYGDKLKCILYGNGSYLTYMGAKGGYISREHEGTGMFSRIKRSDRLCVMVYGGKACHVDEKVVRLCGTELIDIYKTICMTDELSYNVQKRYVYRVLTDKAGLSESFVIYEDGVIAATASVVAKNRRYALIGDVYTVYAHRYKGYASALTDACVAAACAEGLIPVLYCEKELVKMYRKRGFRQLRIYN